MSAGEPLDLVRPVADKRAFLALMNERWGSHRMMIGLNTYDCSEIDLLGLFDESGATLALASWTSEGETALLCALISLAPGTSAAADLLGAVKVAARTSGALKLRAMVMARPDEGWRTRYGGRGTEEFDPSVLEIDPQAANAENVAGAMGRTGPRA